ncbi:unnamed protein product, partial [Porites evermanni]
MVFTMQKPNVCTSRKLAILVVFTFAPSKQKIETLQKTKCRIWDMKGDFPRELDEEEDDDGNVENVEETFDMDNFELNSRKFSEQEFQSLDR